MNLDVFVISKNALVRKTLAEFFEVADDIHVVATGSSTKLTFQKAKGHLPHMIITDFEEHENLQLKSERTYFNDRRFQFTSETTSQCLCIRGDRALRDC